MDVINTSHLTRKYGKQYAVKNVNLNVKKDRFTDF